MNDGTDSRAVPTDSAVESGAFVGFADVGDVHAEGGGQVGLVFLLLDQDAADVFGDGVFAEGFALPDALAVVADRFVLVVEVETEHVFGLVGELDRLHGGRWHAAEIVDLAGDRQRVLQLFTGVDLQLFGDGHVLRAFDGLRVDDVGDDRLVFAGEVFVQQLDEFFAGGVEVFSGIAGLDDADETGAAEEFSAVISIVTVDCSP